MSTQQYASGAPSASAGMAPPPIAPTAGATSTSATSPAASAVTIQPTLKVMRLYKPRLHTLGLTSASLLPTSLADSTALQHEFAMSSMLILPDSFGEIFLGNTFSSYISVINQYSCDLADVGLTVNIQCANDRVELRDNRYARTGKMPPPNPVKVLPAGSCLDMVVDYPLNQVGNHVLRVGVTYQDPITKEAKSLRKFYRFAVQNPLVISFKHAMQQHGESYVEAQVRNVSKLPLFVDSIQFLPALPFAAKELDTKVVDDSEAQGAMDDNLAIQAQLRKGPDTLLNPQEELQRVFRITFDVSVDSSTVHTAQASQNLGRLHVGWKTAVGEAGSVQSQPVLRKTEPQQEIAVALQGLPKSVVLGSPFVATARVTNHSTRTMQLQLQFRKEQMGGIRCSSISHQNLAVLAPHASTSVPVEFLPTVGGLQAIRGGVCVDLRNGQEFAQDVLACLMVHPRPLPAA